MLGAVKTSGHGTDEAELRAVIAASGSNVAPGELAAELIFSEAAASATVGIWRFAGGDWSVVLKVIRHGEAGSPMWRSGEETDHWYFWEREALAYRSGLLDALPRGLRAPRCLGVFRRADDGVAVWMEDLRAARAAAAWDLDGYRAAAHHLGLAQGLQAARWKDPEPWVARRWLRDYVARREPFLRILGDDGAWDHPLVKGHLPADARAEAAAIWDEREVLLAEVEAAPRCLCHNDLHPGNLFSTGEGDVVLIDWAFLGAGHLGEDPGNLVFDAVLDFFVAPGDFEALDSAVTGGYLDGVAASGLGVDPAVVGRAMLALGAVKYFWIPLAMVEAVAEGPPMINRRPFDEGFRWWAPLVPRIFDAARRLRADR